MGSSVPGVGDLSGEDLPERGKKFAAINAEWYAAKTTGWLGASASLANLARGESA
jgi:hypothetical protein